MTPVYLDLHIHTSENEENLNQNYDVDLLLEKVAEVSSNSAFLISLTDHNTINKNAYMKLLEKTKNVILGVELHIKNAETRPPYHCHIYFNFDVITEEAIDGINLILDELYPQKVIKPERIENGESIPETKVENIETIIRKFDQYDFLLLPHGGQNHRTFDESVDGHFNTRLEKSLYYNQFDGFTARNRRGLERTISFFSRLGINEYINLITCTDNYNPVRYPKTKSDDASDFLPTWMLAEPTFDGLRLSLSEHSRLIYSETKPDYWAEYLKSVQLENDSITIDVSLTPGLNVVIGDSSSGKTLFVDAITCKTLNDFSTSNYKSFGVESIEIDNPSHCIPHYINQNYIMSLIAGNKNEIDKIDIIKKVFPDEKDVRDRIQNGLSDLKKDINDLIDYVEKIEKSENEILKIPSLNRLIQTSEIKENIIQLIQPSDDLISKIEYSLSVYEQHLKSIDDLQKFMQNNEFIEYDEVELQTIIDKLKNAYLLSSFEQEVRTQILLGKKSLDDLFSTMNKESQHKKENYEKLITQINQYTDNLNKFKNQLEKIQSYDLTIQSRVIESMGHQLSIEYTFKIDRDIFLKTINEFLKSEYKIGSLEQLNPRELYVANYKERPKVSTYEDFKSKVYIEFENMNKRKYRIITRDGKEFDSLSAGWKTSVLLDLILGYEGDIAPLIIDQPEDNLANSYINKGLIDAIKKIKERKQVIIVSHNATIPMLGDAQNVILCKNDEKILITSNPLEGKINGISVVDHIATITDGGKTSIKKRVKKYNMKKFEEMV
ncbi:MAG: hypothetical protein PHW18_12440 [Sulfuricurvum sp.]|uniref:hypothetical protein n=1 Tax=Sulfuricurvum sp. TaxID=2025608 RepID=UPI00260F0B75|nr:hypothetical protein [Sulfuricurvum sp.]MDD2830375.1 hypothetical protein [Sulfuricurvum sp.]MDD4950296.1 hypothetical protein [Sulfuricurvum sp.]